MDVQRMRREASEIEARLIKLRDLIERESTWAAALRDYSHRHIELPLGLVERSLRCTDAGPGAPEGAYCRPYDPIYGYAYCSASDHYR